MIRFFLLIGLTFQVTSLFSQDKNNCETIYTKAEKLFTNHEYQLAIKKIAAYKLCNPAQTKKADAFLLKIYETVNQQRIEAERQKRAADSISKIAVAERNAALANLLISEAKSYRNTDATLALRLAQESLKIKYYEKNYQTALEIYREGVFYQKVAFDSATESKTSDFETGSMGVTAIDPNNQFVLTGGDDGILRVWNMKGDLTKRISMPVKYDSLDSYLPNPPGILAISFSPSGRFYATLDLSGHLIIRNSLHQISKVFSLPFYQSSETYYAGGIYTIPYQMPKVLFTPNEEWIVTQNHQDSLCFFSILSDSLHQFALVSTKDSLEYNYHPFLYGLDISPDGNKILTLLNENTLRVFDKFGNPLCHFDSLKKELTIARFDNAGQKILAGSKKGELLIYNLLGKLEKSFHTKLEHSLTIDSRIFPVEPGVFSIDCSKNGNYFLLGYGDAKARLWDSSGNLIKEFPHPLHHFWRTDATAEFFAMDALVSTVKFSKNNQFVFTATDFKSAYVWDLIGIPYKELNFGHEGLPNYNADNNTIVDSIYNYPNCIFSISISPNQKSLLMLLENVVYKYSIDTDSFEIFFFCASKVNSMEFSQQGTFMVETCDSVYLLNGNGIVLKQYRAPTELEGISFGPKGDELIYKLRRDIEGILLAPGANNRNFNRCFPEPLEPPSTQNGYGVSFSVRFPYQNTRIEMSSYYSLNAKLIIKDTEHEISRYFKENPTACSFVKKDHAVIIRTADSIARIWDDKGNIQLEMHLVPNIRSVSELYDRQTIVTGDYDGRILFWQAPTMDEFLLNGHLSPLTLQQRKTFGIKP
jgi:WD40 repeat protein